MKNIYLIYAQIAIDKYMLYTNKELAIRLDSIDKLKDDEKINKYLKFIKKQPPSKVATIKKSRNVRKS